MSTLPTRDLEREWMSGVHAGRLDVFEVVFEAYAHRLQHFAQLWVTHDVAEDIVQDVLFDVWQRRAALDPQRGNLTAYLFSAVRNRAADYVRHMRVVERVEDNPNPDSPPGMGTGSTSPDAHVIVDDMWTAVDSALNALSDLQRAALMLHWGQDMSVAQVAGALSISENAAKLHIRRGRQTLSPILRFLLDE